ncbi:HEAT repeat domain-containing protein [Actinomadura sp. HBU206391]|uniref:HEAT repeat domain-containing protein n=1 Tax=Actinomadura sp. HBU206391 TaxID=2731692 RepID=UPI00164EEFE8|nr:HEAT repeat domain-containing protein [Actinomadura sp. HBU206391]MBC6461351.1 HEAT repeat domain-containing protein [Actinomadura sp. HBU206391]
MDALERAGDVAGLAELLHHDRPATVSEAAGALSRIGGRGAVEALLAALEGSDAGTSRQIVRRVGEIGDPAATDRLAGLLYDTADDGGGRVGQDAAKALGRIGGPAAVGALVDALLDEGFPGRRAALRDALRTIMRSRRSTTVRPTRLTRDAGGQARQLVWAGDFGTARALLSEIADGAASVGAASDMTWGGAAYAKASAESAAATVYRLEMMTGHSLDTPGAPSLGTAFEEQALVGTFATLEGFLANLPEDMEATSHPPAGLPDDEPIAEALIRVLRSDDADRLWAVDALRDLGGPEAVAALGECLDDEDAMVRRAALMALNGMDAPASVAALGKCLDDESWPIRLAAVAALRKVSGSEAIAALREMLDDESHEVRKAALAVAARMDGEVLSRGVNDPHEEVRWRAALVAADLDDPRWADALAPLLTEPFRPARAWAAGTLRRWSWAGDDPVQLAIAACAWDEVVEAGVAAAGPLMRMLDEIYAENEPDKEEAMQALERLVAAHGREIPDEVLHAGAEFDDFAGAWTSMADSDDYAPLVDASELRRLCREALQSER